MYCQLEYLANCPPVHIQRALDELPATLDETYECTLQEIKDTNLEYASRLLLCIVVAYHPLRVEELAEILAFDFEARPIPEFCKECHLTNPVAAVLSTYSTLLTLVNVRDYCLFHGYNNHQVAHFSVKEFLTSTRFAEKHDSISSLYHISMTPAHTVITQACLGMLFHLDQTVTQDSLSQFPLVNYAAKYWFEHACFEGVLQNAEEGMKQLFDQMKPYLSIWLWIHDPTVHSWLRSKGAEGPFPLRETPLHYAAFCSLHDIAKNLATRYPNDVNSWSFDDGLMPLYLTSRQGHVDVAWMLVECSADASVQDKDRSTLLHLALSHSHVDVAWMLVECGADASVQDKDRSTPLHLASSKGHVDMSQMLMEHSTNMSVQDKDRSTPLHLASSKGHVDVAQMLVERSADVSVQDKDRSTLLHLVLSHSHVDVARMLVECGTDVSVQDEYGSTPLHLVFSKGHVDVAWMLVERGTDVSVQDSTLLHLALFYSHVDMAWMLAEHGTDASVQDEYGRTPLHLALSHSHVDMAWMLVEHSANLPST